MVMPQGGVLQVFLPWVSNDLTLQTGRGGAVPTESHTGGHQECRGEHPFLLRLREKLWQLSATTFLDLLNEKLLPPKVSVGQKWNKPQRNNLAQEPEALTCRKTVGSAHL